MDKSNPKVADMVEAMCPWPADAPLPTPRFGNPRLPAQGQALPATGAQCDSSAPRFPLALSCQDDELGYRVDVIEQDGPHGIEIWAHAVATRPGRLGQAISLALGSEDGRAEIRVTIRLDTPAANASCTGCANLGTAAALRAALGDRVTVQEVFLLESAR